MIALNRKPRAAIFFAQSRWRRFVFCSILTIVSFLPCAAQIEKPPEQTPAEKPTDKSAEPAPEKPTEKLVEKPTLEVLSRANEGDAPIVAEQPISTESSSLSNLIPEQLVHFGDFLEIDVLGSIEFDWRGRLDEAGFLNGLPEIGEPILALCRSEDEIARSVERAYSAILRNPRVVVRTLDRSTRETAVLLGAVRTAQRFQIERPARLNELIVLSGGITDRASGEVTIFRPANVSCEAPGETAAESDTRRVKLVDLLRGKPDANPLVRSGDVITIEEAAPIYVTGGVAAPQRILFRTGLTVARAVASAGGVSRSADASRITVYRRQPNTAEARIVEVNLANIIKNPASDVALEPYDIIEVSQTGRAREKRAPVVSALDSALVNAAKLPLRVVN